MMTLFINIKNLFSKGEEDSKLELPKDLTGKLELFLDGTIVGYLSCKDGAWVFQYSTEFKNQDEYPPIKEFPDVNKIYKSEVLWPFFRIRIPGLKQPKIKQIIKEENLKTDEFDLLKRFGKRSISNPYILVP